MLCSMYRKDYSNCTIVKFLKLFSDTFYRLCFVKLKLLLLAIEVHSDDSSESKIAINPKKKVKITLNTQGFFIAQSADEVKRYRHCSLFYVLLRKGPTYSGDSNTVLDNLTNIMFLAIFSQSSCNQYTIYEP